MMAEWFLYGGLLCLVANFLHHLVRIYNRSTFTGNILTIETLIGSALLGGYLVTVGMSTGDPLTSRAEIFCLFGLSMLTVYLVVRILDELAVMGTVVIPVGLIFVIVAVLQHAPTNARQLNQPDPGLVSWPHILLVVFAYGAFSVSFLMAVGYLRAEHQLKKKSVDGLFFMLPSLEALDHGLQRSIRIGILTLIAGVSLAIFGGVYQGTVTLAWFQDPNIIGAILTGLIYGTILFIRSRSLFTNRRIAFLAIFGFVLIGVLFFVMNLFPRMHRFL
jgi:ABC-type uncharacterized transport system permease subunit